MKLRNLSAIIFGSLLFIFILNFYFNFFRFPFINVSLFDAVPVQSALIIECNDVENLNKLGTNSALWSSVQKTTLFEKIESDLRDVKSKLFLANDSVHIFKSDKFIAALQKSSAKNADFLYIFDAKGKQFEKEKILQKAEHIEINKSVFQKEEVYELIFPDNQRFTLSFYRNIILLARLPFMVEDAIAQLKNYRKSALAQNDFQLARESLKGKNGISIYFNLQRIAQLFNHSGKNGDLGFLKEMGSLAVLNFRVDELDILIDGTFISNGEMDFEPGSISPSETELFEVIPDNCSFLFWQSQKSKNSDQLLAAKDSVFANYLDPWIGEEAAIFLLESRKIALKDEFLVVYETENIDLAKQLLTEYAEALGSLQDYDYQTFTIRQLFTEGALNGAPFFKYCNLQSPYFTMVEDYVIFSNSRQSLELLIDKHILSQTLSNDGSFLLFKEELKPNSTIFLYSNTALFSPFLRHFSSEFGFEKLDAFLDILGNFNTIGIQLKQVERASKLDFYLNNSKHQTVDTKIIWKANLAADIIIPPTVLKNSQSQKYEIFVQDADNKIYLFDRNGKPLWNRYLKAPIISKIHQIDFYNDGENKILFSTENQIYLIDHEGKDIGNYPLNLPVFASNGLCVVDFENSGDHNFFIGAQNGSVYAFKKTGVPLEGWNPRENVGKLKHDIQHFQVAGNDYILALNDEGDFHVFKRNGEKRFETISLNSRYLSPPGFQTFDKNARIVLGNQNGKAQVFNLKGEHFNLYVGTGNDEKVQFLFADIVGDSRKDYITLSGKNLSCYYYEKSNFKKAFNRHFDSEQNELFAIQFDDKKWQIGTLNKKNKRINLLNNDGSLSDGFPLSGTTKFSVVDLFEADSKVLVTALDNSIYTCKID